MKTIYSEAQVLHDPQGEINRGVIGQPYEAPVRVLNVIEAVRQAGLGPVDAPDDFGLAPIARVHDRAYLSFLEGAHAEWVALGRPGDAIPLASPIRSFRSDRVPASLDGRLSYYSFDISTPITPGSWVNARASANVALTGARAVLEGKERAAFSLCRPPGHHAGADFYGGYCFVNNAAIAAQYLRDNGAARVAILDVDYHHGNGTQAIFYDRADVSYVSIHADPSSDFPYFLGYADETGAGAGEGCNYNLPLPRGIGWEVYEETLEAALRAVASLRPDALVVSLGVDTFDGDPLSGFRLATPDFARLGRRIAATGLPALLVFEGGYALDALGANIVSFLTGYEGG
ncbi:histone deacetylase family protein [Sphingomonas sp.]|uniref:histone deacetylase family protein n=1 Tax=Sphingomonas sp. TaxID=28214 RepID=UPI002ED8DEA9